MPYIYKITNNLNGKIYIGKTIQSVEQRWKEHCKDCHRRRMEKRPLYAAMNKYGCENFSIEAIERCEIDQLNDRERYWIEYYGSFRNGYNATVGGDGKQYLDYDKVYETYRQLGFMTQTAKKLGISEDSVSKIVHMYEQIDFSTPIKNRKTKRVNMYDLNDNFVETFESCYEAARYIMKLLHKESLSVSGISTHIGEVCKGKRKTCYGYKWKYPDS